MDGFAFLVGGVLPYTAVTVFIIGMGYRFYVWVKTPQPGKMTLTPAPASLGKSIIAEALLFPSLFKGDKALWAAAWFFHITLALVFIGHLRVFSGLFDSAMMSAGMSPEAIDTMSATSGGAAGIVLLVTGVWLLSRRLKNKRVREISSVSDFFALVLLVTIIVTGDAMRFGTHFDLEQTRVWASSLLTFGPVIPKNSMFLTHALLAQFLVMYIPFSKVMHFGGIFFTQALVKRS